MNLSTAAAVMISDIEVITDSLKLTKTAVFKIHIHIESRFMMLWYVLLALYPLNYG